MQDTTLTTIFQLNTVYKSIFSRVSEEMGKLPSIVTHSSPSGGAQGARDGLAWSHLILLAQISTEEGLGQLSKLNIEFPRYPR